MNRTLVRVVIVAAGTWLLSATSAFAQSPSCTILGHVRGVWKLQRLHDHTG